MGIAARVRPPLSVKAMVLGLAIGGWAGLACAASPQDHEDCNSDDRDRNIAGCTRLIEDTGESALTRGTALVTRGLAWDFKGEYDRAVEDFTEALRLNPKDARAFNDRALVWREKGDIDRAIADFDAAIAIDPQPGNAGSGHQNVYTNRALAWLASQDVDRAMADFDQAIRLDGNDFQAHYERAQILLSQHQLDRAIADLDDAIRIDPDHAFARSMRGGARYDRYMEDSPWIDPNDLALAITDFTELIRIESGWFGAPYRAAKALYIRAIIWEADGHSDRALADLKEAAMLDPKNEDVTEALERLKQ